MFGSIASFITSPDLVTRRVGGETILVPVRGHVADLESIYTLNDVASLIWERLERGASIATVVEVVCREYAVAPEEARADVTAFLEELQRAGLIRSANREGA